LYFYIEDTSVKHIKYFNAKIMMQLASEREARGSAWKLPPPNSKAAEVWIDSLDDEDNKLFLLSGAVRSSKTVGSLITWADRVASGPKDAPRMMLGNTERTLTRNCIDPLSAFVGRKKCRLNAGTGVLFLFGRKIYLVGANNIGALPKVQGPTLLDAYCDEAATYPPEVFNMLVSRLSLPGAKLWATMNPGPPAHWMKKSFIDRASEIRARVWNFTLDDNPFLEDSYKTWLKSTYTGLWYRRMVLGEWAIAEGAVFSNFDPDKHVIKELPDTEKLDQVRIGVDYGASNPTVFLKAYRYGPKWIIAGEFYHRPREGTQLTNSQYADRMVPFMGKWYPTSIEVDPSAAAFIYELRKHGFRHVHAANNDVSGSIAKISNALNSGTLLIHESCANLIEEMGSYSWDPKATALGLDKPVKSEDHAIDALRYIINAIYY
jgi:PBSX family phage terminase large subunit